MKNEKTHVAVYRRVDAEDTEQETSNRLLASADERRINTHPSWLYAGTYIDSGMERTVSTMSIYSRRIAENEDHYI